MIELHWLFIWLIVAIAAALGFLIAAVVHRLDP